VRAFLPPSGAKPKAVVISDDGQDAAVLEMPRFPLTTPSEFARLASVIIECLPWQGAIRRYDRARTLFYLDPPYWGSAGDCGKNLFGREDFAALAPQFAGIKGQFILSINEPPRSASSSPPSRSRTSKPPTRWPATTGPKRSAN